MNRCPNDDAAEALAELAEADLATVHGGAAILPWFPPTFPIRNPLPLPLLELHPTITRPNAGPRPNPFVSAERELGVNLDRAITFLAP